MSSAIIIAIIIVLIVITFAYSRESMTKIRRTVGTFNTANEIQVAPGIINSMPIMDYRYTWTDGLRVYSCDECPSRIMCPRCPQFHVTPIESATGGKDIEGGESPDHGHGKNLGAQPEETIVRPPVIADAQAEFKDEDLDLIGSCPSRTLLPAFDLDAEFVSSRARIGCGGAMNKNPHRFYGTPPEFRSLIGINNDCIIDGDRMVLPGATCSKGTSSVMSVYSNVMGLPNPGPHTASCEFLGPQGYLYKETCFKV